MAKLFAMNSLFYPGMNFNEQTHKKHNLKFFPAKAWGHVERYWEEEGMRIRDGDFSSRLRYEQDFFYARGFFPLRNSFGSSRYCFALGNILNKFAASDVFLVSLPELKDAALRKRFVHELLGKEGDYPEIPPEFVLEGRDIGEEKPDFTRPEFDGLRSSFRYDLQEFEKLITREGVATDYLDFDALWKNLR
ncbi:hypothetical protein AGMMS50256_33680 [Betaproteobacteria bacterium]|nr:hypothetical protein AGMMS50256_33680 [Betaproteobacteria bacterium]